MIALVEAARPHGRAAAACLIWQLHLLADVPLPPQERPALPPLDATTDSLVFQQLECDYTVSSQVPDFAGNSTEPRAAVIRLFGVTREGNSVCAHVHGFKPYFWVRAPPGFTQEDLPVFQSTLNAKVKAEAPQLIVHSMRELHEKLGTLFIVILRDPSGYEICLVSEETFNPSVREATNYKGPDWSARQDTLAAITGAITGAATSTHDEL